MSDPYLNHQQPHFLEYSLGDVFLDALNGLTVESAGLARKLRQQGDFLLVCDLLLEEYLLCLSQGYAYQSFDSVSAQIDGGSMEEILVDVGEHAGGGLEGVVGGLETGFFGPRLGRGMAG